THYRYTFGRRPMPRQREDGGAPMTLRESLAARGSDASWQPILERRGPQVRIAGQPESVALGLTAPCLPALSALLPESNEVHRHLRLVRAFLRGTRYYPFDETSEVTGLDGLPLVGANEYKQWAAQYQATGGAEDSVLLRLLYAHFERPSQFAE